MSELRHDPIQKRWVIIASDRGKRPLDFVPDAKNKKESFACPFCKDGFEKRIPYTISEIRDSNQNWQVKSVPNKFPALKIEGDLDKRADGIYDVVNGIGAHEVIIESPEHDMDIPSMSIENVHNVLIMYRDRLIDLQKDMRFKYVIIFKNHGQNAGASLEHPHSQIIATPIVPRTVTVELESARQYYLLKERCIFCDIITQELKDNKRILYKDNHYVSMSPYASRFPFEMMIAPVPSKHRHDFSSTTDDELYHLAIVLKDTLSRLKKGLDDPPYNFLIHTSPNTNSNLKGSYYYDTLHYDFHWHIEIIPRLTKKAGFEWATGFYINPTPPEKAIEYLKKITVD